MSGRININLEIDDKYEVPQVIIKTDKKSELIDDLIRAIERVENKEGSKIAAYDGDTVVLVDPESIIRLYTENRRIVVNCESGVYGSRLTLKEYEEILDNDIFIRISRFEIVNLKKVFSFDLSMAGTIKVIFGDGTETWVARRYVKTIQEKLNDLSKGGGIRE